MDPRRRRSARSAIASSAAACELATTASTLAHGEAPGDLPEPRPRPADVDARAPAGHEHGDPGEGPDHPGERVGGHEPGVDDVDVPGEAPVGADRPRASPQAAAGRGPSARLATQAEARGPGSPRASASAASRPGSDSTRKRMSNASLGSAAARMSIWRSAHPGGADGARSTTRSGRPLQAPERRPCHRGPAARARAPAAAPRGAPRRLPSSARGAGRRAWSRRAAPARLDGLARRQPPASSPRRAPRSPTSIGTTAIWKLIGTARKRQPTTSRRASRRRSTAGAGVATGATAPTVTSMRSHRTSPGEPLLGQDRPVPVVGDQAAPLVGRRGALMNLYWPNPMPKTGDIARSAGPARTALSRLSSLAASSASAADGRGPGLGREPPIDEQRIADDHHDDGRRHRHASPSRRLRTKASVTRPARRAATAPRDRDSAGRIRHDRERRQQGQPAAAGTACWRTSPTARTLA